jgi:hypothetical protein
VDPVWPSQPKVTIWGQGVHHLDPVRASWLKVTSLCQGDKIVILFDQVDQLWQAGVEREIGILFDQVHQIRPAKVRGNQVKSIPVSSTPTSTIVIKSLTSPSLTCLVAAGHRTIQFLFFLLRYLTECLYLQRLCQMVDECIRWDKYKANCHLFDKERLQVMLIYKNLQLILVTGFWTDIYLSFYLLDGTFFLIVWDILHCVSNIITILKTLLTPKP